MKIILSLIIVVALCLVFRSQFRIFLITSNSMIPIIKAGDVVVTMKRPPYLEGDIVTFKIHDRYISHRLILNDGFSIQTKGDANSENDSFGTSSYEIEGKVIHILHSAQLKKNLRSMF